MTIDYCLIDKILNAVFPLPEQFGTEDLDEEPTIFSEIRKKLKKIDRFTYLTYGVSKMVILSPKLSVAIKIPFNGFYGYNYDADDFDWYPFQAAEGSDSSDYCLTEYEKYQELKKVNLGCFVAETLFYKTIDNINIFIQERVIPCKEDEFSRTPSRRSLEIAKKLNFHRIIWTAMCVDKYGEEKTKKFLNYCRTTDRSILADLHDGNIGYREDGTPVILDYSNFND